MKLGNINFFGGDTMRSGANYYVGLTLYVRSTKSSLKANESVIVCNVYKKKKRTMLDVKNVVDVIFLNRNSIHLRFKNK